MPYQLHHIDLLLKPYVRVICSMESSVPIGSMVPMRVLPDTCVELFINFCEPQQIQYTGMATTQPGRSFITSRMSHFMDVRSQGKVGFISVCFTGGNAYSFFSVPMHEMANQVVNLNDVWGGCADELQQRIDEATTTTQRVQLVQQHLIARLRKATLPDVGRSAAAVTFCLEQITRANGHLSVEDLARKAGISNRQLVRRFNERIGLSPKEFARITTFLNALKHLKNSSSLSLTEIAYESGYYDQSHFIHACRDYSGLTPRQLLATGNVLY